VRNIRKRLFVLPLMLAAVALTASSCDKVATTSDMCAMVVGTGEQGHDARVHAIVYPNQTASKGDYQTTRYFPCNSRNYIINPPGQKNANGQVVGDRHTPVVAYTKDNTKVIIWLTAYWTPNQDKNVLKNAFAPMCNKYTCASGKSSSGDANFSTEGWNGMLGETVSKGIDQTGLQVVHEFGDDLWKNHDPKLYKELGTKFSENFNDNVRPTTGYDADLFCGSGNSGWKDPSKPGRGDFTCSNVRFEIDSVEPADSELGTQVAKVTGKQAKITANQEQREIAQAKYGDQTDFWLGAQDTLAKCPRGSSCPIYVTPSVLNGK
jgi:hypothetical protein